MNYKEVGIELIDFNIDKMTLLKEWMSGLNLDGRTPKGQKYNKDGLIFISNQIKMHKLFDSDLPIHNISATTSRWTPESVELMTAAFTKERLTSICSKGITVRNESKMTEAKFKNYAREVVKTINSLGLFHKKATNDLVVVLKNKGDIKSIALYKSNLDEIWIQSDSKIDNDLYGHGKYVLVHEIGHRFEAIYGLPEGFSDSKFATTKYSYTMTDFGGSEAFAEAFAVSHWKDKYPEFSKVIDAYIPMMIEHSKNTISKKRSLPAHLTSLGI